MTSFVGTEALVSKSMILSPSPTRLTATVTTQGTASVLDVAVILVDVIVKVSVV